MAASWRRQARWRLLLSRQKPPLTLVKAGAAAEVLVVSAQTPSTQTSAETVASAAPESPRRSAAAEPGAVRPPTTPPTTPTERTRTQASGPEPPEAAGRACSTWTAAVGTSQRRRWNRPWMPGLLLAADCRLPCGAGSETEEFSLEKLELHAV